MSENKFKRRDHQTPCQHIRGYLRATVNEDDVLHLSVRQYTPLSNPSPGPNDITIIAAHANGFGKELYEPLWDDLHDHLSSVGIQIRQILIADIANQGDSGLLNREKLGNDPHWDDHARDLLLMTNYFRVPTPILGVGHSCGGTHIANLALMHPRLMQAVVLIDPIAFPGILGKTHSAAIAATFQQDTWASRESAEDWFRASKQHRSWDPRVLDLHLRNALLEEALKSGNSSRSQAVTLRTTKSQEAFYLARACYPTPNQPLSSYESTRSEEQDMVLHLTRAPDSPFYRPEPRMTYWKLHWLRPPCLYVNPSKTPFAKPDTQQERLEITGVYPGGSGGAAETGAVENVGIEGGHFVPFEKPAIVAKLMGEWLSTHMPQWIACRTLKREEWRRFQPKAEMGEDWIVWMKRQKEQYNNASGKEHGGGSKL